MPEVFDEQNLRFSTVHILDPESETARGLVSFAQKIKDTNNGKLNDELPFELKKSIVAEDAFQDFVRTFYIPRFVAFHFPDGLPGSDRQKANLKAEICNIINGSNNIEARFVFTKEFNTVVNRDLHFDIFSLIDDPKIKLIINISNDGTMFVNGIFDSSFDNYSQSKISNIDPYLTLVGASDEQLFQIDDLAARESLTSTGLELTTLDMIEQLPPNGIAMFSEHDALHRGPSVGTRPFFTIHIHYRSALNEALEKYKEHLVLPIQN